jgi:phosphoribosylglycinamide formyltransferase-1
MNAMESPRLPIVILISGRGSNLQSIIDCARSGALAVDIRAVISNRPDAEGLQIASNAGIYTTVIDHTTFADRDTFDQALQEEIDHHHPGLLVLAGFMRLLSAGFVAHYHGHLLNIHPSLLPELPGLDTHRRAIEAGHCEHGASVHFVSADMDGGPVVAQARVAILPDDTPERLATRVLQQEHRLYPLAIQWFAEHRIYLDDRGQIIFEGKPLTCPRDLAREQPLPC